jgi:non-heme chloroperoxidase
VRERRVRSVGAQRLRDDTGRREDSLHRRRSRAGARGAVRARLDDAGRDWEPQLTFLVDASLRTPANSAFTLGAASTLTDNRAALAKIDRPTLIVAAAGPFIEAFRDMQRRIRGSRLVVVQDVGHALFVDEADQFNRLLEDFLKSVQ